MGERAAVEPMAVGGSRRLGGYLARRLAQVVPVTVLILAVNFTLIHLAPGDPVYLLAGDHGNEAYYAEMRAKYGLDRPVPEQFIRYVLGALRGDLGHSYSYGQPVLAIILDRLPATLLLMLAAQLLAVPASLLLGMLAARRGGRVGVLLRTGASLGYALPVFWVAQLLILVFAHHLRAFPLYGLESARADFQGLARALDVLHHLVLPATALAIVEGGLLVRITDVSVQETGDEEYVRTARAKGLSERAVDWRHLLPNALLPVVTVVGNRVGTLLTGAVLVEIVFAWPGMGRLFYDATLARDYPLLMALFLVSSLAVLLVNLATDLLYAALDPRIEYG